MFEGVFESPKERPRRRPRGRVPSFDELGVPNKRANQPSRLRSLAQRGDPIQEPFRAHAYQAHGLSRHLRRRVEGHGPHVRAGPVERRDQLPDGGLPGPPAVLECAPEPGEQVRLALAAEDGQRPHTIAARGQHFRSANPAFCQQPPPRARASSRRYHGGPRLQFPRQPSSLLVGLRPTGCPIHQVARMHKRSPLPGSNLSTAFIGPIPPSWVRVWMDSLGPRQLSAAPTTRGGSPSRSTRRASSPAVFERSPGSGSRGRVGRSSRPVR